MSAMKETINWLTMIEERASILYAEASVVFAQDPQFSAFLSLLSEEEAEHTALLSSAVDRMGQDTVPESCFCVDETIRREIEKPFDRADALIKKGTLTKAAMVEVIAEAEFSEWNEIFLYVIDTLKGHGRAFQVAVAEIDQHRKDIETFISSFSWGDHILERIRQLNPVWKRHVLVVEDDFAIANLIKCLLKGEAEVVLAIDGEEGLARIREGHFDAIVSDVEMPKLNGIEMYKRAIEFDPDLKDRFVFFTGTLKPEHCRFFKSTQLVMLPKPSAMSVLRETINEVADRVPPDPNSRE